MVGPRLGVGLVALLVAVLVLAPSLSCGSKCLVQGLYDYSWYTSFVAGSLAAMVEAEHLRCCMLCWHVASPYFSRRQKPGFGVWKRRYCIGPLRRDCMFAHELQFLCMPLRDPSGRGYDDEFFQTQVGIYVGQQYRPCLKRMVVAYARGVPSHELPLWYKLFQWVENGYPAGWPEVWGVWDFGYYQLVNEWLRSQGIRRLPFDTRWLRNALHCRRVYLAQHPPSRWQA